MKLIYNIALILHIIAVLGLFFMLLSQLTKSEKRLLPGTLHSAWTALGLGLVMLALNPAIHNNDPKVDLLDHTKFTVKGLAIAIILYLGVKSSKKGKLSSGAWAAMTLLTLANILIASTWN